jgi:Zn-dependent M28 family amino/carboxypeptidase
VAVLIETARMIAETAPEKSGNLLFVAFSTEEPPCFASDFMGSRIFVERMAGSELELRGAIVLEMVGYYRDEPGSQVVPQGLEFLGLPDTGNFIALAADQQSSELAEWAEKGIEGSGAGMPAISLVDTGQFPELSGLMRLSDNASFWDAGIPALMITDTAFLRNPNYHEATDTADTLDYEAMGKLVKALVHTLINPKF